jgi:hypothetical protein
MAFARPHWSADPRRSSEYIALRRQFREACRLVRNPDGSYGAPCSICRRPINYALTHPHPAAFSVDHIRPVRSHPELALSLGNFQPAHWRCNRNTRRRLSAQFTLRMTQQAPAKLDDAARKVTWVGERGREGVAPPAQRRGRREARAAPIRPRFPTPLTVAHFASQPTSAVPTGGGADTCCTRNWDRSLISDAAQTRVCPASAVVFITGFLDVRVGRG